MINTASRLIIWKVEFTSYDQLQPFGIICWVFVTGESIVR